LEATLARPALPANAPRHLCGYAVLEATARPAGTTRNMDGSVVHYAGVARLAHHDGTQTVVWYDESAVLALEDALDNAV
jgi:hypothetical protein